MRLFQLLSKLAALVKELKKKDYKLPAERSF